MKSVSGFWEFLFPNTLAWRLFLLSSIAALAGVAAVAIFISSDYRRSAESRQEELLTANIFNLMGSVQVNETGTLMGLPDLGDSRYSLFDSGWYWSIEKVGEDENRLSSLSLSDRTIDVPVTSDFDETFQRVFEIEEESGQVLSGLEAQVFLGEGSDLFSFKITANISSLESEINEFSQRLFFTLSLFALSIVLAMSQLVRFGLRPVSKAAQILADVRSGDASSIEGKYPDEIQPFIDETNALISSNNTIVERARTQVGNLAHSLKTPLAILQNEVSSVPAEKRELFREQIDTMRQQVQVYLDRARISARSSTAIAKTPLNEELEKLVAVVSKLSPNTDIALDLQTEDSVCFEGEKHDLQEIFGNVIENATKYAETRVRVSSRFESASVTVDVEDDGTGMSAEQIEKAMRRGGRIDEGKSGWGLGLSIVTDIVDEYSGELHLSKSELGGLKASISLPGVN
ncbi:MAG: HAMP domain-containing sensor histidine kinase [Pseudomonadota bacterium]